jgi:hypothetical protein
VRLFSGLRAPADRLTAAAPCNRCRPSRGTRRTQQLLAAALVVGAAVSIWAQSHPTVAQSAQVTNADGPEATARGSAMPDYQLDRSEEDWSGLCRHANGRDDFWDPGTLQGWEAGQHRPMGRNIELVERFLRSANQQEAPADFRTSQKRTVLQ